MNHVKNVVVVIVAGIIGLFIYNLGAASQSSQHASTQVEQTDQIIEKNMKLGDKYETQMDRSIKLLERQEQILTREEADFDRFEKILATWERQQAEYQKYLDGLKH